MQQPIERGASVPAMSKLERLWFVPYAVFIISVLVTLIGIFALDAWAELGGLNHAAQHVTIFLGGAGAGTSFLSALKNRKEN